METQVLVPGSSMGVCFLFVSLSAILAPVPLPPPSPLVHESLIRSDLLDRGSSVRPWLSTGRPTPGPILLQAPA